MALHPLRAPRWILVCLTAAAVVAGACGDEPSVKSSSSAVQPNEKPSASNTESSRNPFDAGAPEWCGRVSQGLATREGISTSAFCVEYALSGIEPYPSEKNPYIGYGDVENMPDDDCASLGSPNLAMPKAFHFGTQRTIGAGLGTFDNANRPAPDINFSLLIDFSVLEYAEPGTYGTGVRGDLDSTTVKVDTFGVSPTREIASRNFFAGGDRGSVPFTWTLTVAEDASGSFTLRNLVSTDGSEFLTIHGRWVCKDINPLNQEPD